MGQLSEDSFPPEIPCLGHCTPGGPGRSGKAAEAFGASALSQPPTTHSLTFPSRCLQPVLEEATRRLQEQPATQSHSKTQAFQLFLQLASSSGHPPKALSLGGGKGFEPASASPLQSCRKLSLSLLICQMGVISTLGTAMRITL